MKTVLAAALVLAFGVAAHIFWSEAWLHSFPSGNLASTGTFTGSEERLYIDDAGQIWNRLPGNRYVRVSK